MLICRLKNKFNSKLTIQIQIWVNRYNNKVANNKNNYNNHKLMN